MGKKTRTYTHQQRERLLGKIMEIGRVSLERALQSGREVSPGGRRRKDPLPNGEGLLSFLLEGEKGRTISNVLQTSTAKNRTG